MDLGTIIFCALSVTLAATALLAWRSGNERRDVALLGALSSVCGAGTVFSVVL